jgi:glycosyltransferase involved in cell wall biosynthesis
VLDKTEESTEAHIKFLPGTDMFNIVGITQVKISDNLMNLSDKVKKSYNLLDYTDRFKPALFYGMFGETDLHLLREHRNKKYLLWDGDDILYLKSDNDEIKLIHRIKKIPDVVHIAPSGAVYTALHKHGISSHKVKINFSINDERFKTPLSKFGNKVLIYNGTDQNFEDRYNKRLYEQLVKKMPDIKFLFTNKLTVPSTEMFKVYKECFVGLRLCRTDGVAQFVNDLTMLGIPVIHNGECNGTIHWKTIDDIITTIRSLAPIIEQPKVSKVYTPTIKLSDITFELTKEQNTVPIVKSNNIIIKYPFNIDCLYSVKINGFRSASRSVKIVLVTVTNDNYVLIDSYLSSELSLNLNYIDTGMYKSIKQLMINDNDGSEFSFDRLTIDEIDHTMAKNEAYESKILDVDEVRIYKDREENRYVVGCIMDTFTYTCFSYEVKLVPLLPDDWMDVIKSNMIDFFLFESAWHGNNGSWDKQLTSYHILDESSEIKKLMKYLNEKKVPKIFYNKEDPFNYEMFSAFAKEFNGPNDLVVTTDENVVDMYKSIGCTNVRAFPFCCQPIIHNPIGKHDSPGKEIIFPCSYYGFKYPERCKQMNEMIDAYIDNIDIFDRQFVFNKQTRQIHEFHKYKDWYEFPEKYRSRIKGSLNYEQVVSLYRKYKCVMNTNTATNSRTMFSRRAIEAAASGVPIISDHALGIETIFGDTATYYDEPDKVKRLLTDTKFRRSISDRIYKKVMHNYTYRHLIKEIIENVPSLSKDRTANDTNDSILCLIFLEEIQNLPKFTDVMDKHKYLIISDTIVDPNHNVVRYEQLSEIDRSFGYYVIMNEWCMYEPDYVRNLLLPTLYTDAVIIGKGAFMHNDITNIVSAELEHRFSNRLNINTIIIKNTDGITKLFDSNIIANIESYMANGFNGLNMYSTDMYDFVDTDVKYHYYNRHIIDMNHLIAKGINVVQTVPIVMCCYNRIDLIGETIKCLNEQTDRNFILYLWNNRYSERERLVNNVNRANPNFNVICHHSKENVGGIGRFYMIRELLKSKDYKYVMFIDDDQRLDKHVVERFKQAAKPKHSLNWYGRRFVKGEPYANIYPDGHVKLNSQPTVAGEPYDYGGTGGMIIDTDIFKHDDLFETLPQKFKFVEDLWMSYYGTVKLGYKFIKIDQGITQIKDGKDQCSKIWDVKNLLLDYCRSQGWNV